MRVHFAHRRLVRGKFLLNLGAHIARGSGEIMLGIVQFVVIQIQLGLGYFEFVIAGRTVRNRKTVYTRLVIFRHLLQLRNFLRKSERLAGGHRPLGAGLTQGHGKGLVGFVVSQAFCLVGKLLFFPAHCQGTQGLGYLPGVQVDNARLFRCRSVRRGVYRPQKGQVRHRAPCCPRKHEAQQEQPNQNKQ
jgi:hypothetical protein